VGNEEDARNQKAAAYQVGFPSIRGSGIKPSKETIPILSTVDYVSPFFENEC
jgi:hypothetical protein